jgi:hypothetical protein
MFIPKRGAEAPRLLSKVYDAPWMIEKLMITASEYEVALKLRNEIKTEPAAKYET